MARRADQTGIPVRAKTTNQVIETRYGPAARLSTWIEDGKLYIEGTRKALVFLSELFASRAYAEEGDCSFGLSPSTGGSGWFRRESTTGIYIH